jgi:hypothetical protein
MAPVKSIAKVSKGLRNSCGLENEKQFSEKFHSTGHALLVSPQLLRLRNLGQIDLARLREDKGGWIVEIGEVKSSQLGFANMEAHQKGRIMSTQSFLSALFGHRTKLLRIHKTNPVR